jgi:hypothetical protein
MRSDAAVMLFHPRQHQPSLSVNQHLAFYGDGVVKCCSMPFSCVKLTLPASDHCYITPGIVVNEVTNANRSFARLVCRDKQIGQAASRKACLYPTILRFRSPDSLLQPAHTIGTSLGNYRSCGKRIRQSTGLQAGVTNRGATCKRFQSA